MDSDFNENYVKNHYEGEKIQYYMVVQYRRSAQGSRFQAAKIIVCACCAGTWWVVFCIACKIALI